MMIDGNRVEMRTAVCGALGLLVKPVVRARRRIRPLWQFGDTVRDFLNAASLAPFFLLSLGVFSSWVLGELVRSGKITLFLAGGIGTLYVLKELLTIEPHDGAAFGTASDS
jgi:hypothetical protein